LLIVDIVRPGTLVSAFSVFYSGASTRVKSKARAFAINVVVGLLQLATFVIIVGWIWSILWGMTFVQLAGTASLLPRYAQRYPSAVYAIVACLFVRPSATSLYCIETIGRIEPVFGVGASYPTYPTPCFKEMWVSPKIKVYVPLRLCFKL